MDPDRLAQQIRFIVEIDKLKSVYRRTILIDKSRNENSAEHSWHIALMVPLLAEHASAKIDMLKTMKMLLVHDLVEIDAGDTYCYDATAHGDKADREEKAAKRIFALLPPDQRDELHALWEEFESQKTHEAQFANALDRLQPLLNNFYTEGESWKKHEVEVGQVLARIRPLMDASGSLARFAEQLVHSAREKGYLR